MSSRLQVMVLKIALAVVLLLCVLWGVTSLTYPFGWDQGLIASVGDVVLQGGMPYRDAWDIKGPLAHLWFAAAQMFFGRGQLGIRVLDLALLTAASLAIGSAAARLAGRSVKPWAAAALVLCYGSMGFFYTAQADGAVALLLTLAFTPLLRPEPSTRSVVLAGFAAGIAALVKPVFLLFLVVPACVILTRRERRAAIDLIATTAAAAVPIVLMAAWFLVRGALPDLIDVHIRFAAGYSEVFELAVRDRLSGLARYFLRFPEAPGAALAVLGAFVIWKRARPAALVTIVWSITALAIVVIQRKFFVYQWSIFFPPAILLATVGLQQFFAPIGESAGTSRRPLLGPVLGAAIFVALGAGPVRDAVNLGRYLAGFDSRHAYYSGFRHEDDNFSPADEMAAAEYLRAHTASTDRVAVFGYDAPVLYLSGRQNATRFSYSLPLVGWRSSREVRTRYQREFMDALRNPPAYLIVGLLFPNRARAFAEFPEFAAYLESGYTKEQSFGGIDLYRRK